MTDATKFLKIDDVFGVFLEYNHKKVVDFIKDSTAPVCAICVFRLKCKMQNPHVQGTHSIFCTDGVYLPTTENEYLLAKLKGEAE